MKKTKGLFLIIILIAVQVFAGCSAEDTATENNPSNSSEPEPLKIVATIFPEYDFARAIAKGTDAEISLLIDPGASVHSFDPSPGDIKTIGGADVFIYVGGESDEWVNGILSSLDTSEMQIVRLIDYVQTYEEELKEGMTEETEEDSDEAAESEEEAEIDEHVWVSPKNAQLLLSAIADAMCEKNPANETLYRENESAYNARLADIDAQITELVENAPRKTIVVADKFPFRYFVEDYGLSYAAAFPGCSDQTDASIQTIAYLIDTVKAQNLPYIYKVELTNGNTATAIAEQTGAEVLTLNSCENITKDEFDSGETYADLFRKNIDVLKKGLY